MPPQGPSSHEDVSLQPPAPTQVAASPLLGIGQELQPPALSLGTAAPLGGVFAEPPLQVVPLAGKCSSLASLQKYPVSSSGMGCSSGKCDPLWHVCHFKCCSLHPELCFPPTLPQMWSHACPAVCTQTKSTTVSHPGQVALHFHKNLPKAAREGSSRLLAVLLLPYQMGKTSFTSSSARQVFEMHQCRLVTYSLPGAGMDRDQNGLLHLSRGDILAMWPCSGVGG